MIASGQDITTDIIHNAAVSFFLIQNIRIYQTHKIMSADDLSS